MNEKPLCPQCLQPLRLDHAGMLVTHKSVYECLGLLRMRVAELEKWVPENDGDRLTIGEQQEIRKYLSDKVSGNKLDLDKLPSWLVELENHKKAVSMDHFNYDDCKPFAEKLRGQNKTTGPHWPLLPRFVFMFDEITRLMELNGMLKALVNGQQLRLSGKDDPGYQQYKTYNPNPDLSYIEWLQTAKQYLEEAAHAAVCGKDPKDYLATKAPTTLRDRIKELEADKRENDVIEIITEFLKTQKGCPSDAIVLLKNDPSTNRLWFEVVSTQQAQETYEPETNSCDAVWNTFELISTNDRIVIEKFEDLVKELEISKLIEFKLKSEKES